MEIFNNKKENPRVVASIANIGRNYLEKKEYAEAIQKFLTAYEIRKEIYANDNFFYIRSLDYLIEAYKGKEDYENFKKYLKIYLEAKKLTFEKKNLGQKYSEIFIVKGNDNHRPAWHYVEITEVEKMTSKSPFFMLY